MENGSGKAGNSEQYQLRQITRCFIRWHWLAIKRGEGRGGCIEYCEHAWFTPFSISFHFSCSLLFSPFFLLHLLCVLSVSFFLFLSIFFFFIYLFFCIFILFVERKERRKLSSERHHLIVEIIIEAFLMEI